MTDSSASASGAVSNTAQEPKLEVLLQRAIEVVDAAKPMPLSASSMINKEELLELLQSCQRRLPEEIQAARWLLKEREEFLKRVHREGDELLNAARSRAEAMVQRSEVVKQAERHARRVVEDAEAAARRLRHKTEDYCDSKLSSFEGVLQRIQNTVADARSRLQGDPLADLRQEYQQETPDDEQEDEQFFDQDTS